MATPQTFIERLDAELPPFCAYYFARKYPRGPWAGPALIAQRAGMARRTVARLGMKVSWVGVDVDVMSRFLAACGFRARNGSPFVMFKIRVYMRYCANEAINPMNHLDERAWRQFNKLSRLHLDRHGAPPQNGKPVELEIKRRMPVRSTVGRNLLQRNARLIEENKRLMALLR